MTTSVALVTLGCARNEVDSEELAGRLAAGGFTLVADLGLVLVPRHGDPGGVAVDRRDRQQPPAVGRRVRVVGLPRHDRPQAGRDVGVVVEAEDRVRLGERLGEVLAVPLGQAAHRDDGLGATAVAGGRLEIGRLEQRVDRVLLRSLDEAAGVDHHGVGVLGVVDQHEATGLEPYGELLGVDLVAGAPEGHHRNVQRGQGKVCLNRHRTVSMPVPATRTAIPGASDPRLTGTS